MCVMVNGGPASVFWDFCLARVAVKLLTHNKLKVKFSFSSTVVVVKSYHPLGLLGINMLSHSNWSKTLLTGSF